MFQCIIGPRKALFTTSSILVLLLATILQTSQVSGADNKKQPEAKAGELYKKLFKVKRKEHIVAIQKLILESSIEKQAKLIEIMMKTIVGTVQSAIQELKVKEVVIDGKFPEELSSKDALAKILENTALFTDLIVRFPELAQNNYQKNKRQWKPIVEAAIEVCNKSGVYEGDHQLVLTSLQQELGIGEVNPLYENPFRKNAGSEMREPTHEERQEMYKEAKRKVKVSKRKQRPKKKGKRSEL